MGTRFELVLCGEDVVYLRAAGEEALDEVERLEAQLSFYRPESELSGLNARAAAAPVAVEPRFFRLLERAARLSAATDGAFDPTVAPLMRCWGLTAGRPEPPALPDAAALAAARERVGMRHVAMASETHSVQFLRSGMCLDLGAIGKGYAIEQAAELLRAAGVPAALLHAGTSTVAALGAPPGAESWTVAIRDPRSPERVLALARLRDRALSASAPHARAFTLDGRRYGHVLDPRTGAPVQRALLAAVVTGSPTDSDALSTALLTLGPAGLPLLQQYDPTCRAFVVFEPPDAVPSGHNNKLGVALLGDPDGELQVLVPAE